MDKSSKSTKKLDNSKVIVEGPSPNPNSKKKSTALSKQDKSKLSFNDFDEEEDDFWIKFVGKIRHVSSISVKGKKVLNSLDFC